MNTIKKIIIAEIITGLGIIFVHFSDAPTNVKIFIFSLGLITVILGFLAYKKEMKDYEIQKKEEITSSGA